MTMDVRSVQEVNTKKRKCDSGDELREQSGPLKPGSQKQLVTESLSQFA